MDIIINNSSMTPIYEQVINQIKAHIMSGELKAEEMLPSVRALAAELRISALTVKKAYDTLEQNGFIITVHGKGSFVAPADSGLMEEAARRDVEDAFQTAIDKARASGMTDETIREIIDLLLEE